MDIKAKFNEIARLVQDAGILMEDGSLRASAAKLRRAADITDELAAYRDQLTTENGAAR